MEIDGYHDDGFVYNRGGQLYVWQTWIIIVVVLSTHGGTVE